MMREVLRRRFARLLRESPREAQVDLPPGADADLPELQVPDDDDAREAAEPPAWPDLILIDGGLGQLTAARETLAQLGLHDIAMVGVAKGPDRDAGFEKFFVPGREPFMLQPRDAVLYFVQRLRDEAHRFAIGSHRTRRKAQLAANPLDEIAGIGPSRKRALLRHFGTAKAIGRASVPDLLAVQGISEQMARAIYEHFHGGG
jgi:excinuclease ABC subunit C